MNLKSKHETTYLTEQVSSYLNFSFDKGGDVVLVLKDGESLQQVVLQPLPVLCDLLTGGSCRGARTESKRRVHRRSRTV